MSLNPDLNRLGSKKANLKIRARVLSSIREFFHNEGFLEIETPVRIPAPAPESHIEAERSDSWFLHTSPELCMKRLMAAGYERIFQISRCFRKGERGNRHLPEFTLLEWYGKGMDYREMMEQTEALIIFIAKQLGMFERFQYRNRVIDLASPWTRMTVKSAIERYASSTLDSTLANDTFDEAVGIEVEPELGWDTPVFLHDYPAACGSLARYLPDNRNFVERFELYIAGLELCNAFGELTDAKEQRKRFILEAAARKKNGLTEYPIPEPFLRDLAHMPECSGNALGIDRLVMLFTNAEHIDDVVAFSPEDL